MTEDEARVTLVALWLEKADEALSSAELELGAGHVAFSVNRLYYACFYAVTALLLQEGKQFSRHSAVRAEFNRAFVKTERVDRKWGRFYGDLFDDRQEGDYLPSKTFEADEVPERLEGVHEFVQLVRGLVGCN